MRTPTYRRQRRKQGPDYAFAVFNGQRIYYGRFDDPESRRKHDRQLAEWLANGRKLRVDSSDVTLTELIEAFVAARVLHKSASTIHGYQMALRPLREHYGDTLASEFDAKLLRGYRDQIIARRTCCTETINRIIHRVRAAFRWAADEDLVEQRVYDGLRRVKALEKGEYGTVHYEPVGAVGWDEVNAILPFVSPEIEAVIKLIRCSGARPGEILTMRPADINTNATFQGQKRYWVFTPVRHKTSHLGKRRLIPISPAGQEILKPFLTECPSIDSPIFSPKRAEAARRALVHANRITPLSCGNRPGTNRKASPKKSPGDYFTTGSLRRHIHRACDKAWPVPDEIKGDPKKAARWREEHRWNPHQLRHAAAEEVLRNSRDVDSVMALLGHSDRRMADRYAPLNPINAIEAAEVIMLPDAGLAS